MANVRSGRIVVFIVSNIAPYGYEVNSILGPPIGSYRFRYDQAWFAVGNPFEINNQEGLVVIREVETAMFYPVRRVKIERVTRVGDIYHIEYTLGKMIDLASNDTKRKAQIEKFTDLLNRELDVPNKPGEYISKSVLLSADHAHSIQDEDFHGDKADQELNSWGTIARVLGSMKFYEDFDFFRLVKLIDEQGNEAKLMTGKGEESRFLLLPGRIYQLSVFQRALFSSPLRSAVERKRDLVLSGVSDDIVSVRPIQHIVGKYDLLNFAFKTSPISQKKDSFLILDVKYENPLDPHLPPIPPVQIPVHITPLKLQKVVRIFSVIFFLIGVYLLFFTDHFLSLFAITITPDKIDLVQRLAILLMVLTATVVGDAAKSFVSIIDFSITPFPRGK